MTILISGFGIGKFPISTTDSVTVRTLAGFPSTLVQANGEPQRPE